MRHGKYQNLEIMVGNLEDVHLEEKFDFVTLIGVLEYAPSYMSTGEEPFLKMLDLAKSYLKPQGTLIIAIENKFGLKYFSGAAEDHTGKFFESIENYPTTSHVRTLSKPEICKLLKQGGFQKNTFYYPLPDYKLPDTVYSEQYLPQKGDIGNVSVTYDRKRYQLFNEEAVYKQLCEDGQFEYFANSFLIFSTM